MSTNAGVRIVIISPAYERICITWIFHGPMAVQNDQNRDNTE